MNDPSAVPPAFEFVTHWKTQCAENDRAVLAFWEREGALALDVRATERLNEVVLHARHRDGDLAGVCTAVTVTLPRLGQPMYYYRCFIGRNRRNSRLALHLLHRTFEVLDAYARSRDFPCIGVLLELENQRFEKKWRMAVWPWNDFIYIGKSARGLDLRLRYFNGANLKSQPKTSG